MTLPRGRRTSDALRAWVALQLTVALFVSGSTLAAKPAKAKPKPVAAPSQQTRSGGGPSIPVTVVEIAGKQAYLRPGAVGGVNRGAKVTLRRKEYTVVETTDSYAMIDLGDDPAEEQDKGQASVTDASTVHRVELAKPHPLSTWEHAWTDAPPPANAQTPRLVPLGGEARDRRWDVRLSMAGGTWLPLGQRGPTLARAELNARIHAEPFDIPVAFDVDASLQRWFATNLDARAGASARPTVYLRELLVSYQRGAWYGGIGRMRYAASTLGSRCAGSSFTRPRPSA